MKIKMTSNTYHDGVLVWKKNDVFEAEDNNDTHYIIPVMNQHFLIIDKKSEKSYITKEKI